MTIPADLLKEWATIKSPEDAKLIASSLSMNPENIRRALREGKCSDKVYTGIVKYYKNKKRKLQKLLK